MENEKEKERLLKYFLNEKNLEEPSIQRRVTASWSFIIFYVASIWTIYTTLGTGSIISFPVVVIFGVITFQYVHSQFASIHYWRVYIASINKIINDLLKPGSNLRLDFSWDRNEDKPKFLLEQMPSYQERVQPFSSKKHPLRIFLRFWFYWFFKFVWEKKGIKEVEKLGNPEKPLSNPAKQEASLYSIIILVTLAYCYLITIWLFFLLVGFSIWYFRKILKEITEMDDHELLENLRLAFLSVLKHSFSL